MKALIPINIKHCLGQQDSAEGPTNSSLIRLYGRFPAYIHCLICVTNTKISGPSYSSKPKRPLNGLIKKQYSPPFSSNGAFSTLSLFQVMTYCNHTNLVLFVSPLNSHTVCQCETWTFSFPHLFPQLQPYSTFTVKPSGLPASMSCTQCIEPESRHDGWC